MNLTDYHPRYKSEISDIHENEYLITIYQHNDYPYTEPQPENFICAKAPIEINQKVTENLIGSACILTMKAFQEQQYLNLFTRREGDYLIKVESAVLDFLWIGVLVPGYYTENFSDPPFDIKISAVDGIGRLKEIYAEDNENEVVLGSKIWERFTEALGKCNVIDEILVQNVFGSVLYNFYDIMSTDYLLQEKNTKKTPFYDFVLEFCKTFDFKLVQYKGKWLLYNGNLSNNTYVTKYDVTTGNWLGAVYIDFTKNVNQRVFEGGTLSIIPPCSTVDVVWTRTTYNAGSQSGLYNSQFLDNMDGWTWRPNFFNNREMAPDQIDIQIQSNDPPLFIPSLENKTCIHARSYIGYLFPVGNIMEYKFFKLSSLPFTVASSDFRINLKLNALATKYNPDDPDEDYSSVHLFFGFLLLDGNSGTKYGYTLVDGESSWVQIPNLTDEPEPGFGVYFDMPSSGNWSDVSLLEEISIPEAGKLIFHLGGILFYMNNNRMNGFPNWYVHEAIVEVLALNSDGEYVSEYEEVLRFQSDEKGFTENKTIELKLANKYEALADGNLFVDLGGNQPEQSGNYQFNSVQERVQELLLYKVVNKHKKSLESLSIDIEGITPGSVVLQNVPGRVGKNFHSDELSFDLRNARTSGKFTERDETLNEIPVKVYSNDRLLIEKNVG